jgi:hypothetical protein
MTKANKQTIGDKLDGFSSTESLETAKTTSFVENSPYENLMRGAGILVKKTGHVLNGNGAQADNIFVITGACECIIWGEVTAVTNSTACSSPSFNLNDGAVDVPLTASAPMGSLSGCVAGALFFKNDYSDVDIGIVNPSQTWSLGIDWNASALLPFGVLKKSGETTNIQFLFTGDENTNITVTFYCRYKPLTANGAIASV